MKNVIKLLLLLVICIASTCGKKYDSENCHYAIKFSNNMAKDLRVRDEFLHPIHYPNSFNIEKLSYTARGEMYKVRSGEQDNRSAMGSRGCVENVFNRVDGFLDTVFVYIFDAAIIENTSWDIVARDYLVLKRYDLTLEDLQRLDWRVTYPPTEAMKDVKQYPPYN